MINYIDGSSAFLGASYVRKQVFCCLLKCTVIEMGLVKNS